MNGPAITVAVVDDETPARQNLRALIRRDSDCRLVGEFASAAEAVEGITALAPDLVFLDVQMPDADGFEVLGRLPAELELAVVFVTAYDVHAVRAFEVAAVDYLLKPFDDERFASALERAKDALRSRRQENRTERLERLLERLEGATRPGEETPPETGDGPLRRFVIREVGRISFVDAETVDYIEADGNYVRLHTAEGVRLLRASMRSLERRLDPTRFVRIHRSAIVNRDRVRELQPSFRGEHLVLLEDGSRLKLSRPFRDSLERLLDESS